MIREEFLYYVWKTKQFDLSNLLTTDGRAVEIVDFGTHNHHSGPDFSNGQILIDGIRWAGNIEMHLKSSDWRLHKHQHDPAYENVILHVVYDHDKEVAFSEGKNLEIPTIVLADRIDPKIMNNYTDLMSQTYWVPCESLLDDRLRMKLNFNVDRMLVDRLERKTEYIQDLLNQSNNDWETVLLTLMARYLGGTTNAAPMEALMRAVPRDVLLKNRDDQTKIASLLFGSAGLLPEQSESSYVDSLISEYEFLKAKYQFSSLKKESWKFFGGRPAGFPTVRIAQLADLILKHSSLFSAVKAATSTKDLYDLLAVSTHSFWDTHFTFDKEAKKKQTKTITKGLKDRLIINAIGPLLFCFAKSTDDQPLADKVVEWLYSLKSENNAIVTKWKSLDLEMKSAAESQAFLQLKNEYCDLRRCLECPVGSSLVGRK